MPPALDDRMYDAPSSMKKPNRLRKEEIVAAYDKYSPSVKWVYEPHDSDRRGSPTTTARMRNVRIVSAGSYVSAQPVWIVGWRDKMSPNTEWVSFTNDPRAEPVIVVGRDKD